MRRYWILHILAPLLITIYALARVLFTDREVLSITGALALVGIFWLLQSLLHWRRMQAALAAGAAEEPKHE
ncbi:MAG: hypothetical protein EA402_02700 [Planctomycetota bacterium]|nr:MAG: hypothetical protein EA402_02700 [Planctomycetota bacterium]